MMPVNDIISVVLIVIGVVLIVIASIGIIRLPDFYLRMSAITKAATLGLAFVLIGLSVHFNDLEVTIKSLVIISLILLTAPVGAHAIARAAYKQGVQFWEGAVIDELRNRVEEKKQIEKQLEKNDAQPALISRYITLLMKLPEEQGGSMKKAEEWANELVKLDQTEGKLHLDEIRKVNDQWG